MGATIVAAVAAVLAALGILSDDGSEVSARAFPRSNIGVSPQTPLDKQDFDNMGAAGVGVLRMPLNWEAVQFGPGDCQPAPAVGVCNWAPTDVVVGNAAERGIRVLPILSNIPGYVFKNHNKPPLGGEAKSGWEDFLDAVVRRYGPDGAFWTGEYIAQGSPFEGEPEPIVEWQVWNEPNGKVYFHPKPDPAKYGKLVKISSRTIKGVDPEAEVVLAGMFGTAEISQPEFLRRFYHVNGIRNYFDAIAVHPYASGLGDMERQIRWARREATRANDGSVELWITELGWGSGSGGHPLERGQKGQSQLLTKAFDLLGRRRERWNIGGVIWFTWQDRRDKQVCRFCRHAGLFTPGGKPKPAWTAFRYATGAGS
jgi:hypothetical protein